MLKFFAITAVLATLVSSPAAAETGPLRDMAAGLKRLVAAGAPGDDAKPLQIVVWNLKKALGTVRVAICTPATFLKTDCPWEGVAQATPQGAVVTIAGLPPGTYAAQVFQDENDNHQVDRNLLGVPKEGVGFSNDAPILLKAPSFAAASFEYAGDGMTLRVKLRHFTP